MLASRSSPEAQIVAYLHQITVEACGCWDWINSREALSASQSMTAQSLADRLNMTANLVGALTEWRLPAAAVQAIPPQTPPKHKSDVFGRSLIAVITSLANTHFSGNKSPAVIANRLAELSALIRARSYDSGKLHSAPDMHFVSPQEADFNFEALQFSAASRAQAVISLDGENGENIDGLFVG